MSQVLGTFSSIEQDRFAAFRRSTFAADAVSDFVASCLEKHSNEASNQRKNGVELGGQSLGIPASCGHGRTNDALLVHHRTFKSNSPTKPLSEYVAPGTSSQITLAVGTIAKCFAQRLVRSARDVANAKGYSNGKTLLPSHVMEAHLNRSKAGLYPGFFMQSDNEGVRNGSSTQFSASSFKKELARALAAQDTYEQTVNTSQN